MLRIVSLISSATEIVHALGLGDFQVGRSHECDFPPNVLSLPVCTQPKFPVDGSSAEIDRLVRETLAEAGSVYDVFDDVLAGLRPTHILTQTQCKVCAVSLEDVERAISARFATAPVVVALEPNSLSDVWDDIRRVAGGCGVANNGGGLVSSLQERLSTIAAKASSSARRPRVACVEWTDPLMVAGNWVPELVELAGGINLFGKPGQHSPPLPWEELVAANPDVIAVMPCGFDLPRTRTELHALVSRPEWPSLRAVREGLVYVTDGNQYFNRPGPRLVESAQILAEIFHPELFPPQLEGKGWERVTKR